MCFYLSDATVIKICKKSFVNFQKGMFLSCFLNSVLYKTAVVSQFLWKFTEIFLGLSLVYNICLLSVHIIDSETKVPNLLACCYFVTLYVSVICMCRKLPQENSPLTFHLMHLPTQMFPIRQNP